MENTTEQSYCVKKLSAYIDSHVMAMHIFQPKGLSSKTDVIIIPESLPQLEAWGSQEDRIIETEATFAELLHPSQEAPVLFHFHCL